MKTKLSEQPPKTKVTKISRTDPDSGYIVRQGKPKGYLLKRAFTYDPETNTYRCPQGQALIYATTNRLGYREYKFNPVQCRDCALLNQCTRSANHVKVLTRHVWQDSKYRTDSYRLTPWGKALYKRRQETVERSFADAKQLHGHRYARLRGLSKVSEQCLLAAAVHNMKNLGYCPPNWKNRADSVAASI